LTGRMPEVIALGLNPLVRIAICQRRYLRNRVGWVSPDKLYYYKQEVFTDIYTGTTGGKC
jgi:hypothetical protein